MKNIRYALLAAAFLFISSAPLAFAQVVTNPVSSDGSATDAQPFAVDCAAPETPFAPFISGNYYTPPEGSTCTYTLPLPTGAVPILEMYKGTPGNAILIDRGLALTPSYTILYSLNNTFGGAQQGDDLFAVAYSVNILADLTGPEDYLSGATSTLPAGITLNILPWKWGVKPRSPVTVTADNQPMIKGSPLPTFTATLSGFVAPDTANSNDVTGSAACTSTATSASAAGTYPITCTAGTLASAGNYTFTTFVPGTLTITAPATSPLTVTADNKTIELGSNIPALTSTLSGFVAPDTANSNDVTGSAACTSTATSASPAGTYFITCAIGSLSASNYTFNTFVPGTLTIVDTTAPAVTITSPVSGHTYLTTDPVPFTATVTDASNAATAQYSFDGTPVTASQPLNFAGAALGASTATVTATDPSHNTSTATVTFTLKGSLTLSADNKTMELGSTVPALTGTLGGFLNGDILATSGTTGSASCTTMATATSPVGVYPITCTAGTLTSGKYSVVAFVPGTLTIVDTTAPVVTINSPVNGATYKKNDIVMAAASATDLSPIASTVYKFNGTVINSANPLPLASAPAGTTTATLVVAATDTYGNTGYATSTFTVAPADLNPPSITITSPLANGLYAKTDTVFLTATVTDQSAIASTTYWFNGVKINPAVALPLSSAPLVNKVSVVATDVHGNTATSTATFYVVKSTNSCLVDIVSVLVAITQDKTIPSKPTILNLIADCSALFKGLHRYDLH